jgi:hypothetical protein
MGEDDSMTRFGVIDIAVQVLYLMDEDESVGETGRTALRDQFSCTTIRDGSSQKALPTQARLYNILILRYPQARPQ